MSVNSIRANLSNLTTDLLVIGVSEKEITQKPKTSDVISFSSINALSEGRLSKILQSADFKGKEGSSCLVTSFSGTRFSNLLVIGVDKEKSQDSFAAIQALRKLGTIIAQNAKKVGAKKVALSAQKFSFEKDLYLQALIEGFILSSYTFDQYKSKKDKKGSLPELSIISDRSISQKSVELAEELCAGTVLTRDLINLPPNVCTPRYLVDTAKDVAQKGKLKIKIFDKNELTKLKCFSLLSVAKGSDEPPYLIRLTYSPQTKKKNPKVISIVGKGVTFDSGGYSIKPADGMITMKCDMAGAAAVLGIMQTVARLKPNVEVRGYIPTTENMINGQATRPGDIVTAMNGKTIEIINTDAEGRLILADALTIASRDKANVIIDIATLTGACMVALGSSYAGLFTDDEKLSADLIKFGEISGERFWRLPLAPEYRSMIKSTYADIKNSAGRWGGAITAALFLKEFVENTRWAHLDIAGPADTEKREDHIVPGGVGFTVRSLTRFILNQ